jgi:hypothetical protein
VAAVRDYVEGLLHIHLNDFTAEEGLDLHKEKDQATGRGVFVSLFNYFLAIRPSVCQFVHQPMCYGTTSTRDHGTSHVSENCTRLASHLRLLIGP